MDIAHIDEINANTIIDGAVIKFSTHNVLSLAEKTDPIKSSQIFEHCRLNKLDFISLTETHHTSSIFYKHNNDDEYTSYWSKPDPHEPYAGVGLLISNKWAQYIV